MKMRGDDWRILLISIILAILPPWGAIVLLSFLPVLLDFLLCEIFPQG